MDLRAKIPENLEQRFLEPEGWNWGQFESHDYKIRYGYVSLENPSAVVVCLPGLAEFCEKYFETARNVLGKNMAFWVIDWPGHGLSERIIKNTDRRHSVGYELERDILHDWVSDHIQPNHPDLGLHILAHSMGGQIGFRYLHEYPDVFSSAGFSAPLFNLKATDLMPVPIVRLLSELGAFAMSSGYAPGQKPWSEDLRDIRKNNIFSHDKDREPLHNKWFLADERLRTDGVTWGWLRETLRSCALIKKPDFIDSIKTPFLVASAGLDALVSEKAIAHIVSQAKHTQHVVFPDSFHEILMEQDHIRDQFLDHFFDLVTHNGP